MFNDPNDVEKPAKARKRRWYQFSLRTLLIFVAVIAAPCAWFGAKLERARLQKQAVQGINATGGKVWYDYEVDRLGNDLPNVKPPEMTLLRAYFGPDFFSTVTKALLSSDAGTEHLNGLSRLQFLDLDGDDMTDAGLANVNGLSRLQWLNVRGSKITIAGLANLRGLDNLQVLSLPWRRTTDAELKSLKGNFPKCNILAHR